MQLRCCLALVIAGSWVTLGYAQPVPKPFPRPSQPPAEEQRPPAQPAGPQPTQQPMQPTTSEPNEATLGLPVYPASTFLASYDAGSGQRYYLFGTNASFEDIVGYYRTVLSQKGDRVFDEPPVHMFEVGRYDENTMAFPPGITIKDYTWGGSQGYLNPKPGAEPARFHTVIQVVPGPTGWVPR